MPILKSTKSSAFIRVTEQGSESIDGRFRGRLGNGYVSDTYFIQAFRITPGSVRSVYAGNGQPGFSGRWWTTDRSTGFPQHVLHSFWMLRDYR
jgi:hypothetical protein